jgi:hypothetical protein
MIRCGLKKAVLPASTLKLLGNKALFISLWNVIQ